MAHPSEVDVLCSSFERWLFPVLQMGKLRVGEARVTQLRATILYLDGLVGRHVKQAARFICRPSVVALQSLSCVWPFNWNLTCRPFNWSLVFRNQALSIWKPPLMNSLRTACVLVTLPDVHFAHAVWSVAPLLDANRARLVERLKPGARFFFSANWGSFLELM